MAPELPTGFARLWSAMYRTPPYFVRAYVGSVGRRAGSTGAQSAKAGVASGGRRSRFRTRSSCCCAMRRSTPLLRRTETAGQPPSLRLTLSDCLCGGD